MIGWLLAIAQTAIFVTAAPLLAGWIKRCRCHLQNRAAPSVLQPYRDLARLFRKNVVVADTTSWLFRLAPYVVFGAAVLAASVVPLIATHLPTSAIADVIVLVGFFALARFVLALAALDAGTAFGGMGASREMSIASLAKPAMLLVVFSYYVALPLVELSTLVTRNTIGISLAIVLLSMLLMITRRQAVSQVVGFMAIENGMFFAAVVSTAGMPMIVELGIAFDVLVAAVLFGVFFLHRQRDVKRLFSYSSIEHMGLMSFAFGIGGPLATFGALLHMTVHSLTKSAIFVTVGHAAQIAGTQSIAQIRGLMRTQPAVGWALVIGTVAIAGFPPFGVFMSEFLLVTATMKSWPWLTVPLLMGLVVGFAGLLRHIQPMVFGEPSENMRALPVNMLPVAVHLLLVLWLGLAVPDFLAGWFDTATRLIAGSALL